jgi:hypothetical protein
VNLVRIYVLFLAGLVWGNDIMNGFHTYLGMVLFVIFFLWFWRVSQRWICLSSLNADRCTLNAVCAPAVVSGLLVLALVAGQEMTTPTQQSIAINCSDYRYESTWSASAACPGKTAIVAQNNPWCSEQAGGGCHTGAIVPLPSSKPNCLPAGSTYGSGSMECCVNNDSPPAACVNNPCYNISFWWDYSGSDCNVTTLRKYVKIGETLCPSGCTPVGSTSPSSECGGIGAMSYISAVCVPEFPAFFPFLFSLLAPLLRWRWRG